MDRFFQILLAAIVISLIAGAIYAVRISSNDAEICKSKGGLFIRTHSGFVCIDSSSIIPLK